LLLPHDRSQPAAADQEPVELKLWQEVLASGGVMSGLESDIDRIPLFVIAHRHGEIAITEAAN
jgi:hypothetical protein